jgi:iron complex outermembrane receptor protein
MGSSDHASEAHRKRTAALAAGLALLPLILPSGAHASEAAEAASDLAQLSLEELGNIDVTSVSKKSEPLSGAPAAIYVITHDDVMQSGANRLPEMLRLAPNLQVAEINAANYAISARGFNGGAADKLLVLVDGRSVYTPFASGVFWDMQDVPRENIERIEVVSGPGGTLWGANAVNGVINIITRKSGDTQGGVLDLGGGNTEASGSLQYGGKISDTLTYRAYVDGFQYGDKEKTGTGAKARDAWHKVQGGFRTDWSPGDDLVTVQGDFQGGVEQALTTADGTTSGQNVLARWSHKMSGTSGLEVQAYYDHIHLAVPSVFSDDLATYDVQVQHNFAWGSRQEIVWGGGYRVTKDDFPTILSSTQPLKFTPQSRTFNLGNVFVQDTISLTDNFKIIPGIKLEQEPYTGLEPLPSVRVAWKVTSSDLLWAAVSRAVRVPSRLDRDINQYAGPIAVVVGGDMQPIKVLAYEAGYRTQPLKDLSFSISAFYNDYPNLRTAEFTNGGLPLTFENGMKGKTYGIETWASYRVNAWWRLAAGANWLHKDLKFKPGSSAFGGTQIAGDDPDYQLSLRSTMNLSRDVTFDMDLRKIGALPAPQSPSYFELGAHLAWNVTDRLELSVTGANLLHAYHEEFGTTANTLQVGAVGVKVPRSVFVDTRWRF